MVCIGHNIQITLSFMVSLVLRFLRSLSFPLRVSNICNPQKTPFSLGWTVPTAIACLFLLSPSTLFLRWPCYKNYPHPCSSATSCTHTRDFFLVCVSHTCNILLFFPFFQPNPLDDAPAASFLTSSDKLLIASGFQNKIKFLLVV